MEKKKTKGKKKGKKKVKKRGKKEKKKKKEKEKRKTLGRGSGSVINRLRIHPGKERLALRQPQGPQPMGTRYDALIHSVSSVTPRSSRFFARCKAVSVDTSLYPWPILLRARGVLLGESKAVSTPSREPVLKKPTRATLLLVPH